MSYAMPKEIPESRVEIEQLKAMMKNSSKPVIMTMIAGSEALEEMHKTACNYCGGEDKYRKYPNYIMYSQFAAILKQDKESTDINLYCADHGIPVINPPT